MTRIAQETVAYQLHLERHRARPDCEQTFEDLLRARAALEVAWLEEAVA